ncbi:PP0621 family protein [Caldimonas sp. KR1-144]|uniref:PP0621 family protein n=1 Tax=Caldimonas sp. KR1-144 TaxID=3400911 RepID=UPI003BFD7BEA
MAKLILIVVLALVVVWWLRGLRRPSPPASSKRSAGPSRAQAMVPCAHCGVHLPRIEAVAGADAGRFYCTEAHRLAAEER